MAVGPSGAGKSTMARLCQRAGAELLSDECVAFMPSGELFGTPFRSDDDLIPSRRSARCDLMLTLIHGASEQLDEAPASEMTRRLLEQAYQPAPGELTAVELLSRAASFAERSIRRHFTFRLDPAAGTYLRDDLRERARPSS